MAALLRVSHCLTIILFYYFMASSLSWFFISTHYFSIYLSFVSLDSILALVIADTNLISSVISYYCDIYVSFRGLFHFIVLYEPIISYALIFIHINLLFIYHFIFYFRGRPRNLSVLHVCLFLDAYV